MALGSFLIAVVYQESLCDSAAVKDSCLAVMLRRLQLQCFIKNRE